MRPCGFQTLELRGGQLFYPLRRWVMLAIAIRALESSQGGAKVGGVGREVKGYLLS